MAGGAAMTYWNSMTERVKEYLAVRRRLGYQLKVEGEELYRFASFADNDKKNKTISTELVISWANTSKKNSQLYRARRLEVVRGLAKYCILFEPETEIPPAGLFGPAHRRISPHIYSLKEISDLMNAAEKLNPPKGLRPATIKCLIGLLSATGMRISEALRFARSDIDFNRNLLVIRETKFHKSRYLPLHQTTMKALAQYSQLRDRLLPLITDSKSFFLLDNGRALNYRQALYAFQILRRQLGWETQTKRLPRLYDFRCTFTCNGLLSWHKQGVDVNNAIMMLSIYLGHSKVSDTYWYISGIPSLMAIAAERFENFVSVT